MEIEYRGLIYGLVFRTKKEESEVTQDSYWRSRENDGTITEMKLIR
jgi:hypothetical protein